MGNLQLGQIPQLPMLVIGVPMDRWRRGFPAQPYLRRLDRRAILFSGIRRQGRRLGLHVPHLLPLHSSSLYMTDRISDWRRDNGGIPRLRSQMQFRRRDPKRDQRGQAVAT